MAELWLPPTSPQARDRVAQQEALLHQMAADYSRMEEWNRELKTIDEDLQLVRAQPNAQAPGLKPGYWHVMKPVPGGPPFLKVVEGPNGEFREPDSALYAELKNWDCWDDRVLRDRRKRQQRLDEARDRQKKREREEMAQEVVERYNAHNPGVSFANVGKGWSYRAGAKRG